MTGDGVLTATVGIGHGSEEVEVTVVDLGGGRCWCWRAGDAAGVEALWLCAGDAEGAADGLGCVEWVECAIVGVGGTEGLAASCPSVSRRRLIPLDVLSFRPSDVALIKI